MIFKEKTPFVKGLGEGDILVGNHSVPNAEYGFLKRISAINQEPENNMVLPGITLPKI